MDSVELYSTQYLKYYLNQSRYSTIYDYSILFQIASPPLQLHSTFKNRRLYNTPAIIFFRHTSVEQFTAKSFAIHDMANWSIGVSMSPGEQSLNCPPPKWSYPYTYYILYIRFWGQMYRHTCFGRISNTITMISYYTILSIGQFSFHALIFP